MVKSQKKDKSSYAEKKAAFWRAVVSQKQTDLRYSLSNTAIEAQTCNEEGLTSIMYAAINNKEKSLDFLLSWYERRHELRRKGWINLRDDNGRTALMMAAALGYVNIVRSLLSSEADITIKDLVGKTARDHAVSRNRTAVTKLFDDWFCESEDEDLIENDNGVLNDELTSTQRHKLKKREKIAQEQRGAVKSVNASNKEDESEEEPESTEPGPRPIWPEIAKVVESVEMLRPICEITITRDKLETELSQFGGVDPALWYQRVINRLEIRLAPKILTLLPGEELVRLQKLQTLILSGNSITALPQEIGRLRHLKVLEISHNALVELPSSLSKCKGLQTIDVSFNQLIALEPLNGLENIGSLQASGNKLKVLDLDFSNLGRLYDLFISNNEITELPPSIGLLSGLMNLTAENNEIAKLPFEITTLKKIKVLNFGGNPIKDQKVAKMLREDQRKDLWKYLGKTGGIKKVVKAGKKEKTDSIKENSRNKTVGEDSDLGAGYGSDDSFGITMEEL